MKKLYFLLVTLLLYSTSFAQQKIEAQGVVISADDNLTVIGAKVLEKGSTTNGTMTDIDGNFTLSVPQGATIVISYMGYLPQEVVVQNSTPLNIVLQPDAAVADEVVVVGYGTQKKSLVTGATTSVKASDLARPGVMRADAALQGKAAGVTVTSNGGQPGDGISVRIRGAGTNGNAQPLYIVDGQQLSNIDFLNPADIANMEILKDAASAAIYGSRGANGVILITTKHGNFNEPLSINASVDYGIQNMSNIMDLLDAKTYMTLQNEAAFNGGQSLMFSAEQIATAGVGTNWQEAIMNKNAPITNAQINFKGGSDVLRYNVSGSYLNQEGTIAPGKSQYERYTFRENTDSEYFDGRVRFGQSVIITATKKGAIDANNIFGGPLMAAINMDPVTPVYNEDGSFAESQYLSQEVVNPVARMAYTYGSYNATQIFGNTYLEADVAEDFKVRSALSLEALYDESWGYTPVYRLNASTSNLVSGTSKTTSDMFGYLWENTITYDKKIGNHAITALGGISFRKYDGSNLGGEKKGLLIDDPAYAYLDLAQDAESARTWGGAWHMAQMSYFGRLNYNYDEKYMLSATFRADGSTRFGENNRFGYFPSVSLGWNMHNEDFFKDSDLFQQFRLRASWGQNGNDNIGDWQYLATIANGARTYEFGGVQYPGASPDKVSNPDIRWETSEQLNIGVDTRFADTFTLSLDYYNKLTKDLLVYVPIPDYVGAPSAASNAGSVRNRGVEMALGYSDYSGDWGWNVNFNLAYNKNEVTSVGSQEGFVAGASVGTSMTSVTRMEEGLPIGYFWGYQTDGVFQNSAEVSSYTSADGTVIQPNAVAGDFRFVDTNGDGIINDLDRTMIGDPNPDFTGGLTLGLTWKKFDFSIFFSGQYGNEIFNATRRWDLPTANYQTSAIYRWHGEGTSNTHARLTTNDTNGNYSRPSDFFVEDGSFLRLKNLTLGYNFDLSKTKIGAQKLRIYFAANNLWTLTGYSGYDPEIGSSSVLSTGIDYGLYPQPRSFVFGLNLTL